MPQNGKNTSLAATRERLRQIGVNRPRVDAFAFADDRSTVCYDWHSHPHHQLLYAFSGVARVETTDGLWLLPPQRAAWIPAGVRHRTTLRRVRSGSVYFQPSRHDMRVPGRIAVFPATALLRELVVAAMRWPNAPRAGNRLAESLFRTLALYCRELAATELPYLLPRGNGFIVRTAIDFTLENLAEISLARVARRVGASPRSLRRHFQAETGTTWREFLLRARLLHAMERLAAGRDNVTETAYACGYRNLSAFSKAFAAFAGENPARYRQNRRRLGGERK